MKKTAFTSILSTIFILFLYSFTLQSDFLTEQKKFSRVRTAISEKETALEKRLKENQILLGKLNLILVAYKDNDLLDVYAKNKTESTYKKIFSLAVCARSGELGPKRKQGDGQVPEGFYHIDRFNPSSNFYLSLGINYPNLADRRKSKSPNLGGDIFIHGSCVTIGCLPMTDNLMKEIYVLAVHAKNNGQAKIPVYIFPFKMTDQNMVSYARTYKDNKALTSFWENLKIGHDEFLKNKTEINFQIAENGDYNF
ncbi:MAG: L,D-transpeptidase family protein [Crocinitomicaceae bacterium]|nr:L,D-transpeptidase family protein [Crocinitomicaceae bacterium]